MYSTWENFAKKIATEKLESWKSHGDTKYMLEHVNERHARVYLDLATKFLTRDQIQHICKINDTVGGSNAHEIDGIFASPSSTRYVSHALDICEQIKRKKLQNVCIVEVGGGYGGLALVLSEVSKIMDVEIDQYVIYDLPGVCELQKFYLDHHNLEYNVVWNDSASFGSDLNTGNRIFLVSAYCISELDSNLRKKYLENLLSKVSGAYLVWNLESLEDLQPHTFEVTEEVPQTGTVNKIIKM